MTKLFFFIWMVIIDLILMYESLIGHMVMSLSQRMGFALIAACFSWFLASAIREVKKMEKAS